MRNHKSVMEEMLLSCGVQVNGDDPWDIIVNDEGFYARVLNEKSLGLGESYVDGWWDCRQIDELIARILRGCLDRKISDNWKLKTAALRASLFNRQTRGGAKEAAERHYDLGNDLFLSFLDPYNQYSCAYFNNTEDLEQAQINKMDLICRKLGLRASDSVLDIGFGWGGLARYMAEKVGCSVTGVNISKEQIDYAREACRNLPVEIAQADYRDIQGSYDKIVSVGMFEHVGRKNYRTFMETAYRALDNYGVFLLHTIGNNESQTDSDPWISKYIFPNSELPSIAQISNAAEGLFVIEDLHNLGPHYEKTLPAWHGRFQDRWEALRPKYDDRFKRMWDYYLLSCAGAFRARAIQLWQIVMTKNGSPQPKCRY
jgi:cyclopropane-fatty-acyl-phospholipid synthase